MILYQLRFTYIFSPIAKLDTNLLACQYTINDNVLIPIFDLSTNGKIIFNITGHNDMIIEIMSLSNGLMASKSLDNTTRIWNWKTGELIHTFNEYTYNDALDSANFHVTIAAMQMKIC